jgi:antitoxin (DNA-binding transcriptional repressor) of toxin-antitoxin stability system
MCISEAQRDKVIIAQNDKPVAVIIGVAGMDAEQLRLSTSDKFWKLMAERCGQKTIGRAELEHRLQSASRS